VTTIGLAVVAAVLTGAVTARVEGQGAVAGASTATTTGAAPAQRTPDGHPDLQGMWNAATLTPLERPETLSSQKAISGAEAAKIAEAEKRRTDARARPSDPNRTAPPKGGDGSTGAAGNVGGYNNFWIDRGTQMMTVNGEHRTSIVIDPEDGRIPALTGEARKRLAAVRTARPTSDAQESQETAAPGAYDDVELRPLGERCLLGFGSTSGPPALPVLYNNFKQIVQTRDHVMILNEMVHDARVIPLNRPHGPSHIRKWMGDSVGRYEGDTLVIETINFTDKTRFRGASERLKVTERLKRLDGNTLLYQFTIEDPSTWTRPWSGEYTWVATDEHLYEYACHEANYALEGILRGERLLDAEKAQQTGTKKP
jgi:hypothetical protein